MNNERLFLIRSDLKKCLSLDPNLTSCIGKRNQITQDGIGIQMDTTTIG